MASNIILNNQPLGRAARSLFPLWDKDAVVPAFLDSASSSQKPRVVIERMAQYLGHEHANIHRGAYKLSGDATKFYEDAREIAAKFINAASSKSVIFTRGTTEAINLVAHSYGQSLVAGDVVLVSLLEHHSNIVPWQLLAQRSDIKLHFVNVASDGSLDSEDLANKLIKLKPKVLSITQTANAIGTLPPVADIISDAHKIGAKVLVDAAQSSAHALVDVQALDADFLVFSGHKVYGPTGIGVLYAKEELLRAMPPFLGGGDMIETVTVDGSTWADIPAKFEAGTPAIAEAIGLGVALDFIDSIGRSRIAAHENNLTKLGFEMLSAEKGVKVYGPITQGKPQGALLSFNVDGVHPHDLATVADSVGVQIRSGHHCAQPLLRHLGIPSTARASFGLYSDVTDLELLVRAIREARKIFARA